MASLCLNPVRTRNGPAADPYTLRDAVYVPPRVVAHNEEEYDSHGFELLSRMQHDHFWYRRRADCCASRCRRSLVPGPGTTKPWDTSAAIPAGTCAAWPRVAVINSWMSAISSSSSGPCCWPAGP